MNTPKASREVQVAFLRNLMQTAILAIVDDEDAVHIDQHVGTEKIVWEVFVAERDMGVALGSHAAHVTAIRTLLNIASKKTEFKFDLTVISNDRRRRS